MLVRESVAAFAQKKNHQRTTRTTWRLKKRSVLLSEFQAWGNRPPGGLREGSFVEAWQSDSLGIREQRQANATKGASEVVHGPLLRTSESTPWLSPGPLRAAAIKPSAALKRPKRAPSSLPSRRPRRPEQPVGKPWEYTWHRLEQHLLS